MNATIARAMYQHFSLVALELDLAASAVAKHTTKDNESCHSALGAHLGHLVSPFRIANSCCTSPRSSKKYVVMAFGVIRCAVNP